MKELSLHILDIIQNSLSAQAKNVDLVVEEDLKEDKLSIIITDDGVGMSEEFLKNVTNPFVTTRKTRKVGLGISLLKANAEQCDGQFSITSTLGKGTRISAEFEHSHIDRPPLGNMVDTILTLLIGNQGTEIRYEHRYEDQSFVFDTKEIREILGNTPLDDIEVLDWLKNYLKEQLDSLV